MRTCLCAMMSILSCNLLPGKTAIIILLHSVESRFLIYIRSNTMTGHHDVPTGHIRDAMISIQATLRLDPVILHDAGESTFPNISGLLTLQVIYAMLCYAMLCYPMLSYALLCSACRDNLTTYIVESAHRCRETAYACTFRK